MPSWIPSEVLSEIRNYSRSSCRNPTRSFFRNSSKTSFWYRCRISFRNCFRNLFRGFLKEMFQRLLQELLGKFIQQFQWKFRSLIAPKVFCTRQGFFFLKCSKIPSLIMHECLRESLQISYLSSCSYTSIIHCRYSIFSSF